MQAILEKTFNSSKDTQQHLKIAQTLEEVVMLQICTDI